MEIFGREGALKPETETVSNYKFLDFCGLMLNGQEKFAILLSDLRFINPKP